MRDNKIFFVSLEFGSVGGAKDAEEAVSLHSILLITVSLLTNEIG